jgi:hypothetical protein
MLCLQKINQVLHLDLELKIGMEGTSGSLGKGMGQGPSTKNQAQLGSNKALKSGTKVHTRSEMKPEMGSNEDFLGGRMLLVQHTSMSRRLVSREAPERKLARSSASGLKQDPSEI